MADTTTFGSLYEFNTAKGNVTIPQTTDVKQQVESAFIDLFGSEISTSTETIVGRQIEAISVLFKDVCGVNAQNASMMNPNLAVGAFLDNFGDMYGIYRLEGEGDYSFRNRILACRAPGVGFAESIARSVYAVGQDIEYVTVLDNGYGDPRMLPLDETSNPPEAFPHSVSVEPHSVYVSVICPAERLADVEDAISRSKSSGCGVMLVIPTRLYVSVLISISDSDYVGTDAVSDTTSAIVGFFESHRNTVTVTKSDVILAIGSAGINIGVVSISYYISDVAFESGTDGIEVEQIVIEPGRYVTVSDSDVSVDIR